MTLLLYLVYAGIGAGAWWGLSNYTELSMELSIGAGALVMAMLGQFHILATRGGNDQDLEDRLFEVEKKARDTKQRMDVVEARTDAVESTVKHELTERRDALVTEMKQLESLIDRLSNSFEAKLTETSSAPLPPRDDEALQAVKAALSDGRIDLHLQPIVSLPQRRVSFYEGFTRLRRPDGSLILPAEFLDPARRAGLLGMIDNMSLFRCVQIVRRLAERDRRVGRVVDLDELGVVVADRDLADEQMVGRLQRRRRIRGSILSRWIGLHGIWLRHAIIAAIVTARSRHEEQCNK